MINVRWRKDLRALDRFENRTEKNTKASVVDAAQALVQDIRSSWSPNSPSSPGQPPAIVSGDLDASVNADERGRNVLGQFASGDNVFAAFVRVEEYYSVYQEEGTSLMAARPFVEPAVRRLEGVYSEFFRDIFRR